MNLHNLKNRAAGLLAVTSAALITSPAFAAIDTTGALAQVDDATDFVTTVGLAVLGLIFVVKGIRWARKAG